MTASDPLIVNPARPTGDTGALDRPAPEHSPWVVGLLLAAFASLISGLATLALVRNDDDVAEPAPTSVVGAPPAATDGEPEAAAAATDTTVASTPEAASTSPAPVVDAAQLDERFPAPGFVRFDGADSPIDSACEVHQPFAPADVETQLSSYLFRRADGRTVVVDRRFGSDDQPPVSLWADDIAPVGAGQIRSVEDIGDTGAFVAVLSLDGDDVELAVTPEADGGLDCGDSVVTNEQGQLAFPTTRIVLASCSSGATGAGLFAAGVTSDGGRFTAQGADDGSVSLAFEVAGRTRLVDPAASSFQSGERVGFSGLVSDGDLTLDITVDLEATDRTCTTADDV